MGRSEARSGTDRGPREEIFGSHLSIDLGTCPKPADDRAGHVANRRSSCLVPAINLVGTLDPKFEVVTCSIVDSLHPRIEGTFSVIGMNDEVQPAQAELLVFRNPRVLDPLPAQEIALTVRIAAPEEKADAFCQHAKPCLRLGDRLAGEDLARNVAEIANYPMTTIGESHAVDLPLVALANATVLAALDVLVVNER